jgi:hypothetical protein
MERLGLRQVSVANQPESLRKHTTTANEQTRLVTCLFDRALSIDEEVLITQPRWSFI